MTETLEPIVEEVMIERPIEHVWRTLTERTPEWLGCMRYRKEIGATFYMQQDRSKAAVDDVGGAAHCKILALDAPHLFRFSWFMPGTPSTFVSLRLEAIGDHQTRVHFSHDGWQFFPPDEIRAIRAALAGGWKSFVMPSLKRMAES